ncbi:MAG: VapC toxin family PIN domain ribonuclease [Thermochromatium sp.]
MAHLYTCAVSRAEIELGLALMPPGKRQAALAQAAQAMFEDDFAGRCLPCDEAAASGYARIVAARTRAGQPIGIENAPIAAIALARGLRLATRNVSDFLNIEGLTVVDPWQAGLL